MEAEIQIGRKRSRSGRAKDIDGVFIGFSTPGSQETWESSSFSPSPSQRRGIRAGGRHLSSQTRVRSREGESSSLESQESRGTTELVLLRRPEEDIGDMCVFLAKAFSQLKSSSSFEAFASYLYQKDYRMCLDALRSRGVEGEVMCHLYRGCWTAESSKLPRESVARVICFLLHQVDVRLLSRRETSVFLLSFLSDSSLLADATTSPSSSNPVLLPAGGAAPTTHWSNVPGRKTKCTVGVGVTSASLEETVRKLCCDGGSEVVEKEASKGEGVLPGENSSSSLCEYILENMSSLLLRQNKEESWQMGGTLHVGLAQEKGIEILSKKLLSCAGANLSTPEASSSSLMKHLLTVLELLTVSPGTRVFTTQLAFCMNVLTSLPFTQHRFAMHDFYTLEKEKDRGGKDQEREGEGVWRKGKHGGAHEGETELVGTTGCPPPDGRDAGTAIIAGRRRQDDEIPLQILCVLTNITAADPYPVEAEAALSLIPYLSSLLLSSHPSLPNSLEEMECLPFALCCSINMAKRECIHANPSTSPPSTSFASALLSHYCQSRCSPVYSGDNRSDDVDAHADDAAKRVKRSEVTELIASFFDELVQKLFFFYTYPESNEYLVIAGYYAILVCMLSLLTYCGESLRIPTISALARCYEKVMRRTDLNNGNGVKKEAAGVALSSFSLEQSLEQPMRIAIAVVQEFLLFQSETGTLCQSTLIEVTEILDRVMVANKISVLHT